jgi:hypothetical protein
VKSVDETPVAAAVSAAWFFRDPSRVTALHAEIDSWLGTPFHPNSRAKGRTGGVDCIRLNEAIAVAVGVVEPFEFPRVPMDFTQHQERSITLEFLRGEYRIPVAAAVSAANLPAGDIPQSGTTADEAIDPQSTRLAARYVELLSPEQIAAGPKSWLPDFQFMPGDLVPIVLGKAAHHLGTVYDESRFVHCLKGVGTILSRLGDPTYASRLHTVFRARAEPLNLSTSQPLN